MSDYTLDVIYQVWDNNHGSRIEVGPDRDDIGLVEIRSYEPGAEKPNDSITMTPEMAVMVASAMMRGLKDIKEAA